ncbi:unnamed protein product, partial [Polarella glacialis]
MNLIAAFVCIRMLNFILGFQDSYQKPFAFIRILLQVWKPCLEQRAAHKQRGRNQQHPPPYKTTNSTRHPLVNKMGPKTRAGRTTTATTTTTTATATATTTTT